MKKSNSLRRMLRAVVVTAATGLATFTGCTKVDDTLGQNLVPENQQMKAGYLTIPQITDLNPKAYVETRLFQTDSIISSNITYGYMGSMVSDTFGIRTAGFLSQYISYYKVDGDYFGYRPFLDSVQILLSISSHGNDTTTLQTFDVYQITSNKYITEKPLTPGKSERDTTFYVNFDPVAAGIVGDRLFSFDLGGDKGPATKTVTMTPTAEGRKFIQQLMLQDGKYKDDYSIYSSDSLEQWVEEFKGLYITPRNAQTTPDGNKIKGTIYATSLDASGFAVYGRNRVKDDPTLIKDTIGMVYYFYDQYASTGNVSVNSIKHDYASAKFQIQDAKETNENRPENNTVFVAGMGGVTTEISFKQDFFDALEAEIAKENSSTDKEFKTLAFSQARMKIYFWGSSYDWQNLTDVGHMIEQMDASQNRLGLYSNYKRLTPITDYAYVYETTYSTTLPYGGYVNRSLGCYVMDITGYMQELWNAYVKQKAETPAGQAVDLSKVKNRSIYLGPEAYGLYSEAYSVAQGMPGDGLDGRQNKQPIRFELTYNMIR